MQSPPPPPSGGMMPPPPPPPGGYMQPPMGGGGAMAAGNLASPGLRIVGGLIDVVILIVINGVIGALLKDVRGLAGVINLIVDVAYFAYFWSSRGQSIGMMPFGFKVRDMATGQFPTLGKAALRGFIWTIEVGLTICIIGAIGWLWQLWDPQKQAIHDKVAGTIVTVS
ncbi:MAG TPA: RDD family protein [Methylomirabilota bacterium]|nr:RDD family protein [Methylomirabilota bacterium]HWO92177.1 RDD family protein [Methylomirabilota bacterium]HXL77120.1 RDD family protein [Candidatus Eisenbacteria bacterium]